MVTKLTNKINKGDIMDIYIGLGFFIAILYIASKLYWDDYSDFFRF
tara:strand:- start:1053 stop:1190 length:138 start_codon:yes stop_codon:yes gene_type:complete